MTHATGINGSIPRRRFLAGSAAALAGAGLAPARPAWAESRRAARAEPPARARNVIFMVADGMSTGTLTLAHLARLQREGKPSRWVEMWNRPGVRRGMSTTHAADSLVTDSAAAGSAWGVGVKVPNGSINIDPSGRQHLPILPHAKQAGKATALVTTTRVTHATPASFAANVPTRELEGAIAEQLLARGIDVILGGGARHFPADLLERHTGYTVARTAAEVEAAVDAPGRLLGLFHASHVPHEIDRGPGVPTLAQMTRCALARMAKAAEAEGFVMQVEGGRVDHAAHNNDAPTLVAEQLAFDEAIGVVLDWADGRDDTLVVITTDHGNANPGLTLYGPRGREGLERLLRSRASFDRIETLAAERGGTKDPEANGRALLEVIAEFTGIEMSPAARRMLQASRRRERTAAFTEMNAWTSVLGQIMAEHWGVSFVSPNHTADLVEVTALGPGSAALRSFHDNTDLHGLVAGALALPPGAMLEGMDRVVTPRRPKKDD